MCVPSLPPTAASYSRHPLMTSTPTCGYGNYVVLEGYESENATKIEQVVMHGAALRFDAARHLPSSLCCRNSILRSEGAGQPQPITKLHGTA